MLTGAELHEFHDAGYVVRPGVFSPAEVERLRAAFDRLESVARSLGDRPVLHGGSRFVLGRAAGAAAVRIQRVVWCGGAEPELSELGRDRRLLELAASILGSRSMHQLINQAHFKLPGDGVEFPWHQDSTHRRYGSAQWRDVNGRGSYVQTLVAVDDMDEHNGPVEFLPGSGAIGHVNGRAKEGLPAELDASRAVAATMPAGSVLLFGPYVFHRSLPNRSNRPRRAFVNGFAVPGANSRLYPGSSAGRLLHV